MIEKLARHRDVRVGAVGALLGVVFLLGALQITPDPSAFNVVGPRIAPLAIGSLTLACSVALIVQALRREPAAAELGARDDLEGSGPGPAGKRSVGRLLAVFAMFTGYILVFIPLGYIVATFLFLVALTTYLDRRKWLRNVVFASVFSVGVYFAFFDGLQVQLPAGLLG